MSLLVRAIDVPDERMEAYKAQLEGMLVSSMETPFLGLYFNPQQAARRSIVSERHVVSVGSYSDVDGVPVEVLLFAVDGRLELLDIIKYNATEDVIVSPWWADIVWKFEEPPI